jgi:hypothetical protein
MSFDSFQLVVTNIISGVLIFYNSAWFTVIKILLGIYTFILLANIIMLVIERGFLTDIRKGFTIGMAAPPELTIKKKKLKIKWLEIKEKLKSENESEYKVAVIEADNLIDDLLKKLGYKGENLSERLDNIYPGQVEHIEEIRRAHETRNRIIHEENFQISQKEAKETLDLYEKFLDFFGVLD